jgi:hypothetical protein
MHVFRRITRQAVACYIYRTQRVGKRVLRFYVGKIRPEAVESFAAGQARLKEQERACQELERNPPRDAVERLLDERIAAIEQRVAAHLEAAGFRRRHGRWKTAVRGNPFLRRRQLPPPDGPVLVP